MSASEPTNVDAPETALQRQSHDVPSESRPTTVVASILLAVFGGLTVGYATNITGGTAAMDGFLIKLSEAIHQRVVKAMTNNYCFHFNFRLIVFTSIVHLSAVPSVWVARALIQSWRRKPVLVIGSILSRVGSALVIWFRNDAMAAIDPSIIGSSMVFF